MAFQDRAYAELYLARLARVLAAERAADPPARHGFALTRETARFLALWMAFDDIVRVADLKCRASRFARVRREVTAGEARHRPHRRSLQAGHPRVRGAAAAVAGDAPRGLGPAAPGARQGARSHSRCTLRTDSVAGFVALRTLAAAARLRRRGAAIAQEQAAIERWLAAIDAAARRGLAARAARSRCAAA